MNKEQKIRELKQKAYILIGFGMFMFFGYLMFDILSGFAPTIICLGTDWICCTAVMFMLVTLPGMGIARKLKELEEG